MLYSGNNLRGRIWKLPNGYWRGCNLAGSQCTFKLHTEAQRFAQKSIVTEQGTKELNTARKFIKTIKNPSQRQYAEHYLLSRLGHMNEPSRPADLPETAAQSIRLELNSILK